MTDLLNSETMHVSADMVWVLWTVLGIVFMFAFGFRAIKKAWAFNKKHHIIEFDYGHEIDCDDDDDDDDD